jgi:WhiB family redox-sensing transcriptional regulator
MRDVRMHGDDDVTTAALGAAARERALALVGGAEHWRTPVPLADPVLLRPAEEHDDAVASGGDSVPVPDDWALPDDGAELGWQERALCAQTDPEAFFPEKGGSTREAKRVCLGCDVRAECLEYALENDERFGIWGGLSERERRRLRKRAV